MQQSLANRKQSHPIAFGVLGLLLFLCLSSLFSWHPQGERSYYDLTIQTANPPALERTGSHDFFKSHPRLTSEVVLRSFIRGAIAFAEGTYPNDKGIYPYQVGVGYVPFDSYDDHPRNYNPDADSDAAGLPQFMSFTWDSLHKKYPGVWFTNAPAFAPKNQDLGAALLMRETGAYQQLQWGTAVDDQDQIQINVDHFMNAIYQSCNIWASFPCSNGLGAYPQNVKPIEDIWASFQSALKQEQNELLLPRPATAEQVIVPETASTWEDAFPEALRSPAIAGDILAGFYVSDVVRIRTTDPVTGKPTNRWHKGFDIASPDGGLPEGTPIFAPVAGTVTGGDDGGRGGKFAIFTPDDNPSQQFVFCHLSLWEAGHYNPGEVFAKSGNTGIGTAPHLHMEGWRFIDGWDFYQFSKGWIQAFMKGELPG